MTIKPSSDHIIEAVLYALAEKQKLGLDMEESVKRAKNDLTHLWIKDMENLEMNMLSH